ncbi:hypothetical protein SAMN05421856_1111 [Chryseobacterium taichungense]|uniref:Uncharacterized protein n=1 Tax=Chryseobacterium taichungense TaxID=295069 RepID=A0A1H8CZJ0_9FLAO|nr:hypothetical protein [Chryseobacterium taichungense]SEM99794.1 hypothetical protein SAMN05421856_1111 [Chryseobacterium taichungense]
MKKLFMIIPEVPLFLRFCARMICVQVFFMTVSISSQTPFSDSDSIIYIADDAYLYADRETIAIITDSEEEKFSNSTQPTYHQSKVLPSSKAAAATACASGKREQSFRFIAPVNSQQFSSTGSFSSQAVMGVPSSRKLLYPMMNPVFPQPRGITLDKKKPLCIAFYPFKINQMIANQFGRPPPILAFLLNTNYLNTNKHKHLCTNSTNDLH